jgi:hypothetical protein
METELYLQVNKLREAKTQQAERQNAIFSPL